MHLQPIESTAAARGSDRITDEEARALARATVTLFAKWGLKDSEACTLLGGLSTSTWARWKRGAVGEIPRDRRSRMAILMGVHKGLRYLFRDARRGYEWVRRPNAAFGGASALEIMLRGEITDLIEVRDYLAAERGL